MRHFTHYWAYDANNLEKIAAVYTPLDHTVGSQFAQRGVGVGDVVYVITVRHGVLFLVGKLQVGEIVFSDAEAEERLRYKPWSGPEHLIASCCTPVQLIEIPAQITARLRFVSRSGKTEPTFVSPGVLDRQTFRSVRRLEPESATQLDRFLPQMRPFSPERESAWRMAHA